MEARLGCKAQMRPCALPGSGGVSVVDWPDGWCFRGLGAREGLGGFAVPDFGRADEFSSASAV